VQDLHISPKSTQAIPRNWVTLATGLRVVATLLSAILFGIFAGSPGSPAAIALLSLAFLLVFVLGAAYRIFINVWLLRHELVSPSWSGATAASALAVVVAALAIRLLGADPDPLFIGYAIAINVAFLLVKPGCLIGGCCGARRSLPLLNISVELRYLEIIATAAILVITIVAALSGFTATAPLGLGAHTVLRLLAHRWLHGAAASWIPLRQPGVELVPLYLLTVLSLVI
jgi:hypothetical protein